MVITPDWELVGCEFKYRNFYFWKEGPSLISLIIIQNRKNSFGLLAFVLLSRRSMKQVSNWSTGWENVASVVQAHRQMNMSICLFMFHDLSTPLKVLVIKEE